MNETTRCTDGLFTQFSRIADQIIDEYGALSERAKAQLRKKGFERRHITSLLKLKQAMIDANFLMTGNAYTAPERNQMELGI